MTKPLSPEAQALLHAGLMADRAMRLVGGQGLNGLIPPAHPDDFSDCMKELRFAVEQYNNHILSMNSSLIRSPTTANRRFLAWRALNEARRALSAVDSPFLAAAKAAAQAVLDAAVCHPVFATHRRIAAALIAAADQVVPDEPPHPLANSAEAQKFGTPEEWMYEGIERDARQEIRRQLLAIADELEAP